MPRVSLKNVQKRVSPRTLSGLASRPPLPPTSTPSQPVLINETQVSEPSPIPNQLPHSSTPTSTFQPSSPLGSLAQRHPSFGYSPPLHSSPSQGNEDRFENNEESNRPSDMSESAPPTDKRTQIAIDKKKKLFVPSKPANNSLLQIVHSHFDEPYTCWSDVSEKTLLGWWTAFKRLYKWDENLFQETEVFAVFNSRGGNHIRGIFNRARDSGTKPSWMKEEIWEKLCHIWETDEKFIKRSTVNKRNRGIALEKGTPSYHGGSSSITEQKKKLKAQLGVEPSIKEMFTQFFGKKDGSLTPAAKNLLDNFDAMVEKANEEADINGTIVDQYQLWIDATGGVSKGRVPFMGSESSTILDQVSSYGMHDRPSSSTYHNVDHFKEDVRNEVASEIAKLNTFFLDKLTQLKENVNEEFGGRVKLVEDKVDNICIIVDEVKTQGQENNNKLDRALEKIMANQNSFFTSMKEMINNSS